MAFRKLLEAEIAALERQGCTATNWARVRCREPLLTERLHDVYFSGDIVLGVLDGEVSFAGGWKRPSGLYRCSVHNCSFGDNVYIADVRNLANYDVEDDVIVEHVGTLVVEGQSSFGNGAELEVLNEGGGRTLKIFDRLSAQVAYLLVLYRHNRGLIEKLEAMIDRYVDTKRSDRGILGRCSRISNCSRIKNVCIGPFAELSGVGVLENGTIAGDPEDPAYVGEGVIARDFIFLSGSKVEDSSILESCLIGQGTRIGKQFSVENSVFFANSEGFHGEACSVFAGPYTVSHHKSTLLIAGLFSFFNAGSGTNQSNHMYKLGPVHQGILERGAKTGSDSYLLWPTRVGAFSAIIGIHKSAFDTSAFPFSYISADDGRSVLTPAMNFFTVGTRRDSQKWPQRDRRKTADKLDLINFRLLSPYVVQKMLAGYGLLLDFYQKTPKTQEFVTHKGIQIHRLMLKNCAKYYDLGIKIFLGNCLIARLENASPPGIEELIRTAPPGKRAAQAGAMAVGPGTGSAVEQAAQAGAEPAASGAKATVPAVEQAAQARATAAEAGATATEPGAKRAATPAAGSGTEPGAEPGTGSAAGGDDWVDLCGLIAPSKAVRDLIDQITRGNIDSLDGVMEQLTALHGRYDQAEWTWCLKIIAKRFGVACRDLSGEQLTQIIDDWEQSTLKLNRMIARDALKEFDPVSRIGFGIDGGKEERDRDFEAVRGAGDCNPFVLQLEEESKAAVARAVKAQEMLEALSPGGTSLKTHKPGSADTAGGTDT